MQKIVYIICFLLLAAGVSAQQVEQLEAAMRENVTLHQDSAISRLLQDKIDGTEGATKEIPGWRVQIYSSNSQQTAKTEALELEKRLLEELPEVAVHVLYTPPFWKVRLGDFRTREEANLLKEEVVRRIPELQGDTYVVRDQITVRK